MKQFPSVLNDVLEELELTQAELGNLSGLGQLKISRLINGVIRADKDDITSLYSPGIPLTHAQKGRLAFAHIQDEMPLEAFKHLQIHVAPTELRDAMEKSIDHLPGRAQRALRWLLNAQDDFPNLGDLFIEMAKFGGWEEKVTPGSKKDTARKIVDTVTGRKPVRYPRPSE